ncbi:hypothetical protein [Aliidiomarina maris]|nr:hypothetical protein [Aliidiomarina maris]MCL5051169.1 hypothetical protein [Bacillota bacterium]
MNIQKTIAAVTAPIGMIFLLSDPQDLANLIASTGLNWHGVFMPIAIGIIFGCLAGLLKFDRVQKLAVPVVYVTTALVSFGIIASVAIYFEHGHWFLAQPTLWLVAVGFGLYAFIRTQAQFSQKREA